MVRCNLSVLLAERRLNISRAASDTGISRTTLTALAHNHSQGIQYDTLNTLCAYLGTTPDKLILYHPADFRIDEISRVGIADPFSDELDAEIKITVIKNKRASACFLLAHAVCFYDEACPCFKITLEMAEPDNVEVFEGNNDVFLQEFGALPASFARDLELTIFDKISDLWPEHHEPVLATFWWPA